MVLHVSVVANCMTQGSVYGLANFRVSGSGSRVVMSSAEMATAVSAPLGACVRGFPTPERLHPFERALLHLTFGPDMYERRLARMGTLRHSAVEVWISHVTE